MKHYINEIKDIARANKAGSFSDACDMFLANVNNTHREDAQYHYGGRIRWTTRPCIPG